MDRTVQSRGGCRWRDPWRRALHQCPWVSQKKKKKPHLSRTFPYLTTSKPSPFGPFSVACAINSFLYFASFALSTPKCDSVAGEEGVSWNNEEVECEYNLYSLTNYFCCATLLNSMQRLERQRRTTAGTAEGTGGRREVWCEKKCRQKNLLK